MTDTNKIKELIKQELIEANKIHPQFHSPHEAYAVILEEIEECQDEMESIEMYARGMWLSVKEDEEIKAELMQMENSAIYLIAEAIQVAAMCRKGLAMYGVKGNEKI